MPIDFFDAHAPSPITSATYAHAVTPHDTDELPFTSTWLHVGGAGSVVVRMKQADGSFADITYVCVAGTVLFIRTDRIMATGTTATGIVAHS